MIPSSRDPSAVPVFVLKLMPYQRGASVTEEMLEMDARASAHGKGGIYAVCVSSLKRPSNAIRVFCAAETGTATGKGVSDPQELSCCLSPIWKRLPMSTVHTMFDTKRLRLAVAEAFTPHLPSQFRDGSSRTEGADSRTVQEMLGHASIRRRRFTPT
jgi:site-specific recombinase XerC